MPAPGLQALILCGPGSSFPTFTANPDENPKALLPIANRPMVWYPIEFCYRSGITNITLVCPPSAAEAITTALNTNPFLTGLPHPHPDLLAPKDLDYNTVCELGGDRLLQAWMVKAASLTNLLDDEESSTPNGGMGVWYETKTETPIKGEETDLIATSPMPPSSAPISMDSLLPHLSYLTYSMPTDSLRDLTDEKGIFPIRHGLLRKCPKLRMLTTHRDAHIYILPKWILDFIQRNERLETIGEDVIGWWAKASWQTGLFDKLGFKSILDSTSTSEPGQSPHDPATSGEYEGSASPTGSQERSQRAPHEPFPKRYDGLIARPKQSVVPPLLAYIHPSQQEAPLIRRVDTTQLLLAVSLQLAKLPSIEEAGPGPVSPFAHTKKVAYPDGVKPRTTITRQDCLVADNVVVEEKTSIKESVVGANCQIKEGAKLFQCLLMDGVVVGKGCKLTRCILGKRSEVGEGSTLTNCEVQENLLVEPRTDDKDNKLMSSSGLEASEQEMQDVLQEMDDGDSIEDGESALVD
ncbi:hypothetical protein DL767_000529 [Monosporascus sp. MG133]|nr:hypothetical protein DL767_000529 [Monosporascus sp. MG133]